MFINNGFEYLGNFDANYANQLGQEIFEIIDIKNLFIEDKKDSEKFASVKTNPIPGKNLAEKMYIT